MIKGLERSVISWLSGFSELPEIFPEATEKANGTLLLKIKDGPDEVQGYIYGGDVKKSIFTLTLRVSNYDTATRSGAIGTLEKAAEICEKSLPSLDGGLALKAGTESHPKLKRRTDNGDDEYEASFYILYWEENE
ncbi:MAG: hypothetical protein E7477_01770 [Ruminococcaceae bacterium]|nr:hypothetical protein [Oscillospiraceae bacterium]